MAKTKENKIKIIVSPDSFERSVHSSNVVGHIWFENGQFSFPDRAWYDFPVIILGWWANSLAELLGNRRDKCELYFMDGPYKLVVEAIENNIWNIRFLKDTNSGIQFMYELLVDYKRLIRQVFSSCSIVINYCREKKWFNKDYDCLVLNHKVLRGVWDQKKNIS
jgi:hypothetical protein